VDTLPLAPPGPAEFYMVHDRIWQAARGPRHGYLCIGCLEARLGRQLHCRDFKAVPLNSLHPYWRDKAWWHRSQRLRDRLTAPSPDDGTQLALWETA
jgi:hypothetical protein